MLLESLLAYAHFVAILSVVVFITRPSQETGAEGVAKSGRERSVK